jgi:hypothetical protein
VPIATLVAGIGLLAIELVLAVVVLKGRTGRARRS